MATKKKRLTLSFTDRTLENIEFLKSYWKTKQISKAIEWTIDYCIVNCLFDSENKR